MVANLRAHWEFQGDYLDSVQGLSAASVTGTPVDMDIGPSGWGAYRFDQTRLYGTASAWDIAGLDEMTLSFWAKADTGNSYGFTFRMGIFGDFNYGVTILSNIWRFEWYDSAATTFRSLATPSGSAKTEEWQHVLVTRDPSHYVKIYLDGILSAEGQTQASPSASTFAFGASNNANSQQYRGWLSDVRVYDDVVEDHVIERLSQRKDPELELMARWFTGRDGRYTDETGRGNDVIPISASPDWVDGRLPGTLIPNFTNGKIGYIADDVKLSRRYSVHLWTEFPLSGTDGTWNSLGRFSSSLLGYPIIVDSGGELGVYANSGAGFVGSGFDIDNVAAGWHSLAAVVTNFSDNHIGWTDYYIDGDWIGRADAAAYDPGGIGEIGGISNNTQSWGKIQDLTLWSGHLNSRDIKRLISEQPSETWDRMDGSTDLTLSQTATEYLAGSDILNVDTTARSTGDGTGAVYYGGANLESNTGTASIDFDSVSIPAGTYRVSTFIVGDTTKIHLGTTQGGTDILNTTAAAGYSERTFTLGSTTTVYARAHLDGSSEISRVTLFSIASAGAQLRTHDGASGGYLRLRDDATGNITQKTRQEGYTSFFFRDDGTPLGPIASQIYSVTGSSLKEGWRVTRTATGVEFELWDAINGQPNKMSFTVGDYSTNGGSNSYSLSGTDVELVQGEDNSAPLVVDMNGDLSDGSYVLHKTTTTNRVRIGTTSASDNLADLAVGDNGAHFKLDGTGPFFTFQHGTATSSTGTADFTGLTLEAKPYHSATTTDNTWHHCAVTWSRDKKRCRFYLDGANVYESEFFGFTDNDVDFILRVGHSDNVHDTDDDTDRWNGDFDELRTGDYYLEGDRAREFWFRPALRLPLDGADSLEDLSPYTRNTTPVGGDPVTSPQTSPVGTGAVLFDDSTWYVDCTHDTNLNPAGQSFTVMGWIRIAPTGNARWSSGKGSAWANAATSGWSMTHWNDNPTPVGVTFYMGDGLPPNTTSYHVTGSSATLNRETWRHFAFVVNREAGTIRGFNDGAFFATTTFRTDFGWVMNNDTMRVGQGNGNYTLADFSDYRIYNCALTDEQVAEAYSSRARLSSDGTLRSYGLDTSGGDAKELLLPVNDPYMWPAVENNSEYFESAGPGGLPVVIGAEAGDAQFKDILATSLLSDDIAYDGTSEYTTSLWARNTLGSDYELGWSGDSGVMKNDIGAHTEWKHYDSTSTPTARDAERYEVRDAVGTVTNYIRNPWFVGAKRGALSNSYSQITTITNMTVVYYGNTIGNCEIIDVGEDQGQPFIIMRYSGTNTTESTLYPALWFETMTHVPAPVGTDVTLSMEMESRMDVHPVSDPIRFGGHWRDSGGGFLGVPGTSFSPDFSRTRRTFTVTSSVTNTEYIYPAIYLVVSPGSSYDWTFTVWSLMATNQSSFTGVVLPPKNRIEDSTGRLEIAGLSMRKSASSPDQNSRVLNTGVVESTGISKDSVGEPMRMHPGGTITVEIDEEAP